MPPKNKRTDAEQVAEFMEKLEHPLKAEIEQLRGVIAAADPRLTERIKWNAPSFCVDGDDRITFNLHGGKGDSFLLVFHCGAKSGTVAEPILEDETGLLHWVTGNRATVKFTGKPDVDAKKEKLASVIVRWLHASSR